MSSPAPGNTNGTDDRSNVNTEQPSVLPGISEYLGDDAQSSAEQTNGNVEGHGESSLGAPKPETSLRRHDSPQNNDIDTTMKDSNTDGQSINANTDGNVNEAPTDPSAATVTTEPVVEPAIDSNDPNGPIEIIVMDKENHVAFKIRRNTKMGKMMARYAETSGKNRATLRFLFDGDKVVDGDTPASLEMEDGNTIEVVQEQVGG